MEAAKLKGIISLVVSGFGFALMALCVRLCDDYGASISSFQKSFFRNAVALVIALIVFLRVKKERRDSSASLSLSSILLLLTRSICGTVGIFANFYALSRITIAEGQTLNKTAPFFTVIFALIFLKERVGWRQLASLCLAFSGVLLITKPGFAGEASFPLAMGLVGGVGAGAAYTCVRALRTRGVESSLIILFFSLFSCLASIPFIATGFDPMTWTQVLILLGAGAGAAIGQFGVTLAYGFAPPKDIAVFDYSNILFTAAFGYLFFAQVPDLFSCFGFAAIIFASLKLAR